jgi:hypothetical protein
MKLHIQLLTPYKDLHSRLIKGDFPSLAEQMRQGYLLRTGVANKNISITSKGVYCRQPLGAACIIHSYMLLHVEVDAKLDQCWSTGNF